MRHWFSSNTPRISPARYRRGSFIGWLAPARPILVGQLVWKLCGKHHQLITFGRKEECMGLGYNWLLNRSKIGDPWQHSLNRLIAVGMKYPFECVRYSYTINILQCFLLFNNRTLPPCTYLDESPIFVGTELIIQNLFWNRNILKQEEWTFAFI